jgi:raffinose/stachyose/melibiose transport system permease protein
MINKSLKTWTLHMILCAYVFLTLIPLIWILLSAFKTNVDIMVNPLGPPTGFYTENFINTWVDAHIGTYFLNSVIVSVISTIVTLWFASTAAFALTRMFFKKLSQVLTTMIVMGLTVPAGVLLVPLYFIIVDLHIYNSYLALIMPYITFGLPFAIIVMMSFMRSIPDEILEAAIIDGSPITYLFRKIVVPLTLPIFVTIFILTYISNWNEFVMAQFYTSDMNLRTLPVGMVAFRDQFHTNYVGIAVGVMYSITPVLIIYALLQEKIISGLTSGSIKG